MNPMNRWTRRLLPALLLSFAPLFASAQTPVREAPRDVRPGRLVVTQPPEVLLDGKPDRLSPGARIRSTQNMLVLSGSLVNQPLPVVYRRDSMGLLHELWILTEAEYTRLGGRSPGTNPEALQEFNNVLALIFGSRGDGTR
jgi:hypothetical protein